MITIGLDEYGHFELEDFSFIGGVVYEGEDYKEEEVRILNFLKKACKETNTRYPEDLHKNKDGEVNNSDKVKKVKEYINENLHEFLKSSGKYHITCILRDNTYRKDIKSKGNLIDDNYAGNRYEHMMYNLVNNIVFNNICAKDKDINLNIATRISVIPLKEENILKEFERIGYKLNGNKITNFTDKYGKDFPSKMYFGTDEKTFRTFLSTMMIYNRNEDINFNKINITQIDYHKESEAMAFLYLADFVCSYIKKNYLKEKNPKYNNNIYSYKFNFHEFLEEATEISLNKEPYIWVYEDIDGIYNNVMNSFYKNDIFNTLNYLYEGKVSESKYSDYYNKYWFKKIIKSLKLKGIINLENAINLLEQNIRKDPLRLEFIFKNLESLLENDEEIKKSSKYNELRYKLADLGLRIYNHKGDIKKSDYEFSICEKLKDKVSIEKYLETANRQSVNYSNKFEFEKALELSDYNEECFKIIKEAKKEIAELNENKGNASWKVLELGKCLSSSGQYLAFMKNEKALEKFKAAIEEFNGEEKNIRQTLSYILHFAIDNNNRNLYEEYCKEYFYGGKTLEEQFNNIINGTFKGRDKDYALYVFIKALDILYSDEIKIDFINKIRTMDKNKLGFSVDSHPWELIYKHLGNLYFKKNEKKYFKDSIDKGIKIQEKDLTVDLIKYSIELEYAFKTDDLKTLSKKIKEFEKLINDKEIIAFKDCIKENNAKTYESIINKFTFMYS